VLGAKARFPIIEQVMVENDLGTLIRENEDHNNLDITTHLDYIIKKLGSNTFAEREHARVFRGSLHF